MRFLITSVLILTSAITYGQQIANCINILEKDSVKMYFKSHGILVNKECADYYRIAKLNSQVYAFNGYVKDYYITEEIAVECYYSNNVLNGFFKSYYRNGQVREQGLIVFGQKEGEWRYWFENGQLKKVIIFNDGDYFLKEAYKKNGKKLIIDGNGEFNEDDLMPQSIIRGEIRNGKQHGEWTIYNKLSNSKTAIEKFDNGKFIQGQNIAMVQSFNTKYFENPNSVIDLTTDLLGLSYFEKIECLKYGESNSYHQKRYNSYVTDLPFFDYIYMNFDPPKINEGYIIAGFKIDKNGEIQDVSLYSTIQDKSIEKQLYQVFSLCEKWEAETLNNYPIETTELFVFQFYNGEYKILNDSRNKYPPPMLTLDTAAKYKFGPENLLNDIISNLKLPNVFYKDTFNISACFSFHIDEKGNLADEDGSFIDRLRVSENEKILYQALVNSFKKTGIWQPALSANKPASHYFNAVLNIKNGTPKLRLFNRNWVAE